MKLLGYLGLVALIGAATWLAIVRVAEHKAAALAGPGSFRLEGRSSVEARTFDALLDQLRRWNQEPLASSLHAVEQGGHLWIAPELAGQRSAIYVDVLSLVRRIYVRREDLVGRELPFPDLDVPEAAQRQFTTIRLAGTLYHELQHYEGLEDENATYGREIEWYAELRPSVVGGLEGERAHWREWAVDSAIESALAARERAASEPAG